ncbi:MAG: undecaprenyl-diphosphate phosphatase [Epsilonproteobacteria bacterium]|jgi:undecaprenyl-diphosphatase|nr:undecaprenyl-diphosphate phosphatase [Campylobacterota bacterium]NPA89602.1 undecaprenyl-diphosphate phosphatase [Campylobacterota bacterium]
MDLFSTLILSIIEGVTEFLPVSSTAHMIIASSLLGLKQTQTHIAFEIIIQLGATLALVLIYFQKLNWGNRELWGKVFIAFLPLLIVGYLVKDWVDKFFNLWWAGAMFIIGGIIFILVEWWQKRHPPKITSVEKVGVKEAIIVGISQIFAIIPGTSRSGATIVGGMLAGLDRKSATDFSFLVAIPTMFAVTGYSLLKNWHLFTHQQWVSLAVGFVTAFITSYIAVKLFLLFVKRFTLIPFAIYRILFGILLLYLLSKGVISP